MAEFGPSPQDPQSTFSQAEEVSNLDVQRSELDQAEVELRRVMDNYGVSQDNLHGVWGHLSNDQVMEASTAIDEAQARVNALRPPPMKDLDTPSSSVAA